MIDVPIDSLLTDIANEVLGPIYVYQYACSVLWVLHDYFVFAAILLVLIWLSAAYDIYMRYDNVTGHSMKLMAARLSSAQLTTVLLRSAQVR